jgi:hypothetical protein
MQIQQQNRTALQRSALSTLALGLVALAALLMPNPARAWQVFKVDPLCNDPSVYSTIQAALNDAALHADGDHFNYVWISNRTTYSGQHIVVNDPATVIIEGGFTDCFDNDPGTDRTTVSGSGNGGQPVFDVTGYGWLVVLSNLNITGGQTSGDGGGIRFNGWGELDVGQSSVYLNQAGYGGGINFNGSGGNGSLYLLQNTTVLNNTANVSGGGIRIEGSARLYALQSQTWIGYNHANGGYGGGLEILGPARADLGSGGYNSVGVISYNDAVDGGGAAVIPLSTNQATLRIFTTDAANPVQIDNNSASAHGGAVYLGAASNINGAFLCAYDFRLHDNAGADGAAIYSDTNSGGLNDVGGQVYLNTVSLDGYCGPESPPALGAVDCAAGVPCNEIRGNQAVDINAVPTTGAAIVIASGGWLDGDAFSLRSNAAAELIRATGNNNIGVVNARNCLIAGNHTQHELFSMRDGGSPLHMDSCTVAGNTIDNGYVIYSNSRQFSLVDSIIDQPGYSVLDYVGDPGNRTIDYVIANDLATLPGAQHAWTGAPVYVNAANGDYHLAANSMGVDYAPAMGGYDLDGKPRDVDLASRGNLYGPRDLGAYERQTGGCGAADTIFCDGFGP